MVRKHGAARQRLLKDIDALIRRTGQRVIERRDGSFVYLPVYPITNILVTFSLDLEDCGK